ncbi:hypothetical protein UA08_07719 [Talaromyces atroroseus]|uniref:DUF1275 domain protein n=1 Tax=Talaromyces atroroseus TaxID=1441469 RepID=A0A225APD4_TALAT|nr:hypothetical protein UA08_07719 [Talaromyces atroroseus]OKL56826.1 hypothetical protein UA08_07719 [Talaromyces atroroseus]
MTGASPHETDALIGHNNNGHLANTKPKHSRLWHHFKEEIDPRHCDLIMLYCYLITGFLDSSSTLIWGSFVSMQTGNTVYLGLGLAGVSGSGDRAIKSGASIASFCIGSMFFGAFYRLFPGLRRWVLCVSFTIQMLLMVCAAVIVTTERPSRESELTWRVIVPVILVAFQSSGQAVTSHVMGLGGLSSVVLTNTYCDLFSHVEIFSPVTLMKSLPQRRRFFAVVLLLLGTILGGIWARSSVGICALTSYPPTL